MLQLEVLNKLGGSTKIKIGAKDGSACFYCGTVSDLTENFSNYSDRVRKECEKRLKNSETDYKRFIGKDPGSREAYFASKVRQPDFDREAPLGEDYIRFLISVGHEADIRYKSYLQRKTDRKKYIPLRQREVISCFKNEVYADADVTCIVIEGKEHGKYWVYGDAGEKHLAFYSGGGSV